MTRLMTTAAVTACLMVPAAFAQTAPAPAPVVIPVQQGTPETQPAQSAPKPARIGCNKARQVTS